MNWAMVIMCFASASASLAATSTCSRPRFKWSGIRLACSLALSVRSSPPYTPRILPPCHTEPT